MPRRIPEYPDVYYFWNGISSYGSFLSFVGVLLFIHIIADSFSYYQTFDIVIIRHQVESRVYLSMAPTPKIYFDMWNYYRGYRPDFVEYILGPHSTALEKEFLGGKKVIWRIF